MKRSARWLAIGIAAAVAGSVLSVSSAVVAPSVAGAATIVTEGPLTEVTTTPDLNCAVHHAGDTSGAFFADTACGTFAVVDDVMYSPASIPAGQPGTPWTPVSQVGPTGSGTPADPHRIVTVVDAGESGVRITQTDSYIDGEESYRTDIAIANTGAARTVRLYRAGDCFLEDSDAGFGEVDATSGAVACKSSISDRIEQFLPLTAGSSYYEAGFSAVWSQIAQKLPFPNTCECESLIDNGMGLSWDVAVASGGSSTVSSILTFSPLGIVPLTVGKTADAAESAPGAANGYTITVNNPNDTAVNLTSITDALPAGFGYTPGSTTGATTADPSVAAGTLTWSGPIAVPADGSASLHFGVTVSTTPGTYTNTASATADGFTVVSAGAAAAVTVTGTPVDPLVVGLAPATSSGETGTDHTVTATVTRSGAPQAGVAVGFSVTAGPNAGTTGTGSTNGAGQATFTYQSETAGTDTLVASVDDGGTTRTSNPVTREWTEAPPPTGALEVGSTSEPEVVTAGAALLRTITVTNTGATPIGGVTVTFTVPPGGTVVFTDPSQGSCGPLTGGTVTCVLGTLAGGATATVRIAIGVPGSLPPGSTFSVPAVVTATGEPPVSSEETPTPVEPPVPGEAHGFVPPGGTLRTGTVATPDDNTIAAFSLPNTGPGAVISITSEPCAPGVCFGKTMTFTPFEGYDDPRNPAVFSITWDRTVRGTGLFSQAYVLKENETQFRKVPPCTRPPQRHHHRQWDHRHRRWFWTWVWFHHHRQPSHWDWLLGGRTGYANPSPCVNLKTFIAGGDLRFDTLFLSGDPSMRRR